MTTQTDSALSSPDEAAPCPTRDVMLSIAETAYLARIEEQLAQFWTSVYTSRGLDPRACDRSPVLRDPANGQVVGVRVGVRS